VFGLYGEHLAREAEDALQRGDPRKARQLAVQARGYVRNIPELRAQACLIAGSAARYADDARGALKLADEACSAAKESRNVALGLKACIFREHVRETQLQWHEVLRDSVALADAARDRDLPAEELMALGRLSQSAFKVGRRSEAVHAAESMRRLVLDNEFDNDDVAFYGLCAGLVKLHYGSLDEAATLLNWSRGLVSHAEWQVLHGFPRAHLALKAGDHEAGYYMLADAIGRANRLGFAQTARAGERFTRTLR
jgi:hypothetical protein